MRVEPDAITLLSRALRASAHGAGLRIELSDARSRPWSSATFDGERIELNLTADGAAQGWLAGLGEADLPMRGWFVADLELRGVELRALMLRAA